MQMEDNVKLTNDALVETGEAKILSLAQQKLKDISADALDKDEEVSARIGARENFEQRAAYATRALAQDPKIIELQAKTKAEILDKDFEKRSHDYAQAFLMKANPEKYSKEQNAKNLLKKAVVASQKNGPEGLGNQKTSNGFSQILDTASELMKEME